MKSEWNTKFVFILKFEVKPSFMFVHTLLDEGMQNSEGIRRRRQTVLSKEAVEVSVN